MADFIAKLKVDSKEYDSKIERARSGLLALEKNLKETGKDFTQADAAQVQFVKDMGRMETVSRTAAGQMTELKKTFTDLSIQYKRMSDLERQSPIGQAMAQSLGQLKGRMASLRTDLAMVEKQLSGAGGNAFTRGLGSAFSMFGPAALATTGVMAAVGGLKKVMGDVVNINMQFEQSTAVLASIMGKTTSEISDLTAQAKQLGAATRYTAQQITELQTNLARLGFSSQEILNSTTAVQALATATGADLGEAANLAGAALRGFGLNAAEMERVASVLSVSTTKSALSFEKLATAVPIVAPVAKQFGFTIEDTVTLLAKLSDAGMDASSAATATRNIFLRMANESGKLATALGRPVHSVEEFGEALKEMRERGMSLSDILNMVGVRSTAAFAVFADNADTLKDFKQSITDCGDAMHDMESKQLNTLQGSVTIMKSAWEGLMLTFSDSNGILKSTTDALTNLLQAWTNWRKRDAGGDAAISSYELGMTDKQRKGAQAIVAGYRAGGMKDSEIKQRAESEIDAINKEKESVRALYDELDKLNKKGTDVKAQEWSYWNKQFSQAFPSYDPAMDGNNRQTYLEKTIAGLNDKIAYQEYIKGLVTPSVAPTAAPSGSAEGESNTAKLRAQYEAEEKEQIARLDRMAMQEEDYEAKVYEIRRASMEKIAALYNEDTAEHARALARISQLEIEYQGKQMRFATRRDKSDDRTLASILGIPKKDTRATEGNISALRQKLQKELSSATVGSEGYLIAADSLVDLNSFSNLLKAAVDSGLDLNSYQSQETLSKIRLYMDIPDEEWLSLENEINEKRAQLGKEPIKLDVKTGGIKTVKSDVESMTQSWQIAAQAISQVGSAMQNIENPAAKIAGLIAGAIAQVAFAAGEAISAKDTTASGWAWIGAAAAITATMISTIVAIKQATAGSYEEGGIVPGNSFHGDHLTAAVNSGELILSRSQQDSIASQLQNGNPFANLRLTTEISGANLRVVLNNDNRSRGGERTFYSEIH